MPAGDLCTLSDLTSYLGDPNISATSLTALSFLISSVSGWVQGFSERNMVGIQSYTFTADGNGGGAVFLPEGPVTGVTSVVIDGVSVPSSPGSPTYGFLASDCDVVIIGGRFPRGLRNVVITYTAGFPYTFTLGVSPPLDILTGTPADLRWAVVETVALRYKRRLSLGKMSEGLTGQTTAYDSSIAPKDAMAIFQKYKKNIPW